MTEPARLVLASASPRRRALLSQLGLSFDVSATHVDETVPPGKSPEAAVLEIAERKLDAHLRKSKTGSFVLAVDTDVVIGAHLFGKPSERLGAKRMLTELSGRTHRVLSGLVLGTPTGTRFAVYEESRVTLAKLSAAQIDSYVATGEPFDKAGGYAVQGQGAAFIEKVEGDYTNVVGLPLRATLRLLAQGGFPLPPHLRI